ncbi:hypothetical protein DSC45_09335 [Streptomyces sp. YIM 130001]|uniref:hypothetical protein n=1 Tax=Streptomyces sp. YIM 130001 TaxID=2259644 RepID=UPI000E65CB09|nr:hypothetical protein [Streptomyces sp. YIM 130001]RII18811.1 hypothetical protein DSC45_09335 [Streptomyces sp. YIM 130001]
MPPPPPLGRSRKRAREGFDAALDDSELAAARDALDRGRWTAVRSLLADTSDDWDRRGHRLVVLGQAPSTASWAEEWRLAEPESADAAALVAAADVFRALRGKLRPESAQETCRTAAALAPDDPTPWLGLLLLARSLGTEEEVLQLFDEVRHRHPDHHHAHHLMVARLAERRPAAGQDPMHEVYDFASWAAEQAPADSPLSLLPVIAHTERYRVLAAAGSEPADPAASDHWSGRRARGVMRRAFDWWLEWDGIHHPRGRIDLNFLAHGKFCEGRAAEAAALFQRIGPHATPAPWSYPNRDPDKSFRAARRAAFGSA